jgi:hypothetical protein
LHFLYFAKLAGAFEVEQAVPTAAYPTPSVNKIRREPIRVCAAIGPLELPAGARPRAGGDLRTDD